MKQFKKFAPRPKFVHDGFVKTINVQSTLRTHIRVDLQNWREKFGEGKTNDLSLVG